MLHIFLTSPLDECDLVAVLFQVLGSSHDGLQRMAPPRTVKRVIIQFNDTYFRVIIMQCYSFYGEILLCSVSVECNEQSVRSMFTY